MRSLHAVGRSLVLVVALALVLPPPARAADVTAVLDQARRALAPARTMRANVAIEIVNPAGGNVVWKGVYTRRQAPEPRIDLRLESPPTLRGTAVSVTQADDGDTKAHLYLPTIRRTRVIEGDLRGESFLGTDFNYEDLGFESLDFEEHRLETTTAEAGETRYRVVSIPSRGWWYGRIVRSIDAESGLPMRTEYYDRAGVLWKVRTIDEVQTIDGRPTPTQITMKTVPTDTATRLTFRDIEFGVALPAPLLAGMQPAD